MRLRAETSCDMPGNVKKHDFSTSEYLHRLTRRHKIGSVVIDLSLIEAQPEVVLAKLEACRKSMGMTNRDFAKYMGVTGASWSRIQHGLQPLTPNFISRVVRHQPELRAIISNRAA